MSGNNIPPNQYGWGFNAYEMPQNRINFDLNRVWGIPDFRVSSIDIARHQNSLNFQRNSLRDINELSLSQIEVNFLLNHDCCARTLRGILPDLDREAQSRVEQFIHLLEIFQTEQEVVHMFASMQMNRNNSQ